MATFQFSEDFKSDKYVYFTKSELTQFLNFLNRLEGATVIINKPIRITGDNDD